MTGGPARSPLVDLNADLGERPGAQGRHADLVLLSLVSSANVACGFHAGDARIMHQVCSAAAAHGVQVGAHFGYRDPEGFGRRTLALGSAELAEQTAQQVATLQEIAAQEGTGVTYAKPHGALYHRLQHDDEAAQSVIACLLAARVPAALCAPCSALLDAATQHGLQAVQEGFADRSYAGAVFLVPRTKPNALLSGESAAEQAVSLALGRPPRAADGTPVRTPVRSLCLHGDSPGALSTAACVREALIRAGVTIQAFAGTLSPSVRRTSG